MRTSVLQVCVSAACAIAAWSGTVLGAGDEPVRSAQEKKIAELEAQVAVLEASVEALGAVVEGTAHPVNLGRTSLARVSASSVNGDRSLANEYYGVLNAFDDGTNWVGSINYTYWLSGGEERPHIEVVFDHLVSVTSIVVEGGPAFSTRFDFANGGQQSHPMADDHLEFDSTVHGVTKVRLTFGLGESSLNLKVHEVRIMGYVPPGVEYVEGRPRILVDERQARVIAEGAYRTWSGMLLPKATDPKVDTRDGTMTFTYHRNGIDFIRVTVGMSSGEVKVEPLVRVVESRPEPAADPSSNTADGDTAAEDDRLRE